MGSSVEGGGVRLEKRLGAVPVVNINVNHRHTLHAVLCLHAHARPHAHEHMHNSRKADDRTMQHLRMADEGKKPPQKTKSRTTPKFELACRRDGD